MKESEVHLHQDPLGRALRVLTPGSYLRLDECKTLKKPRFDRIWQLVAQMIKNPPAMQETHSIPGLGRCLEKGMATHSSILAWRIP